MTVKRVEVMGRQGGVTVINPKGMLESARESTHRGTAAVAEVTIRTGAFLGAVLIGGCWGLGMGIVEGCKHALTPAEQREAELAACRPLEPNRQVYNEGVTIEQRG